MNQYLFCPKEPIDQIRDGINLNLIPQPSLWLFNAEYPQERASLCYIKIPPIEAGHTIKNLHTKGWWASDREYEFAEISKETALIKPCLIVQTAFLDLVKSQYWKPKGISSPPIVWYWSPHKPKTRIYLGEPGMGVRVGDCHDLPKSQIFDPKSDSVFMQTGMEW